MSPKMISKMRQNLKSKAFKSFALPSLKFIFFQSLEGGKVKPLNVILTPTSHGDVCQYLPKILA